MGQVKELQTQLRELHRLAIHVGLDLKRAGLEHHAERIQWAEDYIAQVRTWMECDGEAAGDGATTKAAHH